MIPDPLYFVALVNIADDDWHDQSGPFVDLNYCKQLQAEWNVRNDRNIYTAKIFKVEELK